MSARDARALLQLSPEPDERFDVDRTLRRGGYPVAVQAADEETRRLWFDGYVRTYLERDLQQLAQIEGLIDFRRLMRVCALRVGRLLNQADLGRDAGLSPATTHRYLNLLETSYQIHRLPAYAVNRTKRLIKAPRLFWTDTGLAAHLAGIDAASIDGIRGPLLENFVLCQLLAWQEIVTPRPELTYWRTAAGEEVDFVLEWMGRLLPIEVKSGARPGRDDARSVESFLAEYADQCRFGIVLHTGAELRLLSENVAAVPLSLLG